MLSTGIGIVVTVQTKSIIINKTISKNCKYIRTYIRSLQTLTQKTLFIPKLKKTRQKIFTQNLKKFLIFPINFPSFSSLSLRTLTPATASSSSLPNCPLFLPFSTWEIGAWTTSSRLVPPPCPAAEPERKHPSPYSDFLLFRVWTRDGFMTIRDAFRTRSGLPSSSIFVSHLAISIS